jgi:hypothetical protein
MIRLDASNLRPALAGRFSIYSKSYHEPNPHAHILLGMTAPWPPPDRFHLLKALAWLLLALVLGIIAIALG